MYIKLAIAHSTTSESAVMVEWLEHRTPRMLTKVRDSSSTNSYKADWSSVTVKSSMIEASDLAWLTSSSNHAINGVSVL